MWGGAVTRVSDKVGDWAAGEVSEKAKDAKGRKKTTRKSAKKARV